MTDLLRRSSGLLRTLKHLDYRLHSTLRLRRRAVEIPIDLDPLQRLLSQSDLQLYDVIVEVARQPVRSGDDLKSAMETVSGESVLVKCQRVTSDGQTEQRLIVIDREQVSLDL